MVYPRVEETGVTVRKRSRRNSRIPKKTFAPHKGLVTRVAGERGEAKRVMAAFRAGIEGVAVATPLIEVGVDVPNATVMLIENAKQSPAGAPYQLRGASWGAGRMTLQCILVAAAKSVISRQRLRVLEETGDGFRSAEADWKLRGPGELLGQQQSGLPLCSFWQSGGGFGIDQIGAGFFAGQGELF